MFRKITATFFLTLASVIMLVFAVIPHHHHQEYICFTTTDCGNQCPGGHHCTDEEAPAESSHDCVRTLFQTQVNRNQTLTHSCESGHCHHFILNPFIVANILRLLSQEANTTIIPDSFFREKLHEIFFVSNFTGRAPPFKG